jgi:hypothetical protein
MTLIHQTSTSQRVSEWDSAGAVGLKEEVGGGGGGDAWDWSVTFENISPSLLFLVLERALPSIADDTQQLQVLLMCCYVLLMCC